MPAIVAVHRRYVQAPFPAWTAIDVDRLIPEPPTRWTQPLLPQDRNYSLDYERAPERRGVWMMSEGYFMAPMQELNDAYASLLAVRYFELYRRDPERFRAGYLALLSDGYTDEPCALLRRRLGIDMMANDFAAAAMASLQSEVNALYQ